MTFLHSKLKLKMRNGMSSGLAWCVLNKFNQNCTYCFIHSSRHLVFWSPDGWLTEWADVVIIIVVFDVIVASCEMQSTHKTIQYKNERDNNNNKPEKCIPWPSDSDALRVCKICIHFHCMERTRLTPFIFLIFKQ